MRKIDATVVHINFNFDEQNMLIVNFLILVKRIIFLVKIVHFSLICCDSYESNFLHNPRLSNLMLAFYCALKIQCNSLILLLSTSKISERIDRILLFDNIMSILAF